MNCPYERVSGAPAERDFAKLNLQNSGDSAPPPHRTGATLVYFLESSTLYTLYQEPSYLSNIARDWVAVRTLGLDFSIGTKSQTMSRLSPD